MMLNSIGNVGIVKGRAELLLSQTGYFIIVTVNRLLEISGENTMKIWIISIADVGGRIKLRAFAKKEDAVAEMEEIRETIDRQSRHSFAVLENMDDLLVVASYGDDQTCRDEEAVMTELNVTEMSDKK